jgi:Ca2+/Na+ antiporter
MMNFFRLSITFVIAFILATFLFFLQFPFWVVILTTLVFLLAFVVLPQIFTVYRSNNEKAIEKYLIANKKKPLFAYPLALAHGNDLEVEESLRAILAKYNQPYMQNVYKTILALHLKNFEAADIYAEKIDSEPLKSYYAAYIAAKKGDFEEAKRHEENISVDWMIHALHALYAKEQGYHDTFTIESKKAIDGSRGVQKYIVIHSIKNV